MIALAILLQAAAPAAPVTRVTAAPPERFSILTGPCPAPAREGDVVVCGESIAEQQRVPLSDGYVYDHGVPSNKFMTGSGALAAEGTPCAATQGGCQVGFGPPIVPMIAAGIRAIGNANKTAREARARRADGPNRVAIDLTAAPPAGRLER